MSAGRGGAAEYRAQRATRYRQPVAYRSRTLLRFLAVVTVIVAAIGLVGSAGARASGSAGAPAGSGGPGTGPWSAPTAALAGSKPFGPGGLACTDDDFCISIDGFGGTYVLQRGSWSKSPAVMPDTPKSINDTHGTDPDSLDCATPSLCVAGGNDGAVWLWNGISWQADFAPHASGQIVSPACPRNTAVPVCYLTIGNTFARYDGGATWKALGPVESGPHPPSVISLSCPTASFCEGAAGTQAVTWQGRSWSHPSAIPGLPSDAITALSCPAAGQCTLFPTNLNGDLTDIWRDDRGQWSRFRTSATGPLDGSETDDPDCLSVSYCLLAAVGESGSGELDIVEFGPSPGAVSVSAAANAAGPALAVSCGSVCAAGLPGGSFTDTALPAPAITSVAPGTGPASGITPYQAAGVPLPAPVQVRGNNLELANEVLFADTPAVSVQADGDDLLLVQPPPGPAGSAAVRIAWAGGLTGRVPGISYSYVNRPLRISFAGEPSVTGRTGQPPRISAVLVIANQPIGRSRLVWRELDGVVGGAVPVGPLLPGRHRIQLPAGSAQLTPLSARVSVCLDVSQSSATCEYGSAAVTSPPRASLPWWAWLAAGLLIVAVIVLAGWQVRRRRRPPVAVSEAAAEKA